MCLVCGALSKESRCRVHRTNEARGYGKAHRDSRKNALLTAPFCVHCGHGAEATGRCGFYGCQRCPLEWHHVSELYGSRSSLVDDRRQLLCKLCHLAVKEV